MKRILSVLFALVVVVTTTSTVYAQCSNATLTGSYAFSTPGFTTTGRGTVVGHEDPFAAMGVLAFDGAGSISISYTFAFRGVISPGLTSSGTYTVNSDCTGSISFTTGDAAGLNLNTAIIGGGTELFGIITTPTFTANFDAKKQ